MIFDNYFDEYSERLMLIQELIIVKCTFSQIIRESRGTFVFVFDKLAFYDVIIPGNDSKIQ